jgi:hypothetical protein
MNANQTQIKDFEIFKLQNVEDPEETYYVVRVTLEPASMMAKVLRYLTIPDKVCQSIR